MHILTQRFGPRRSRPLRSKERKLNDIKCWCQYKHARQQSWNLAATSQLPCRIGKASMASVSRKRIGPKLTKTPYKLLNFTLPSLPELMMFCALCLLKKAPAQLRTDTFTLKPQPGGYLVLRSRRPSIITWSCTGVSCYEIGLRSLRWTCFSQQQRRQRQ